MSITITVPNDDHVALRAMSKALEEIAVARGAPAHSLQVTMGPICTVSLSSEQEERLRERLNRFKDSETRAKADGTDPISQVVRAAETDTTSQQVESLGNRQTTIPDFGTYPGKPIPTEDNVADSTGTPWDERIHSASKALNSDGTWRVRRKPADKTPEEWAEYIKWVEEDIHLVESLRPEEDEEENNELQPPLYEVSPGHIGVMQAEPPVTPTGDDFHVDAGVVTEQEVAAIPAPPLPVPPVPQTLTPEQEVKVAEVVAQATMTFPQVMQFLTERHGRITSAQVDDIIADMGLNSIMDLNTQPEHTGPFIARVKALLGE